MRAGTCARSRTRFGPGAWIRRRSRAPGGSSKRAEDVLCPFRVRQSRFRDVAYSWHTCTHTLPGPL
eukprot:3960323-Prymnesium_polylepis.1